MSSVPIYQMASFSRSGETLMLRALNAHSQIDVVHQILKPDTEDDLRLFRFIKTEEPTEMDRADELLAHRTLADDGVLVVKNAVWVNKRPWRGFIYVRHPFSVMSSARVVGQEAPEAYENHKEQCNRWGRGIDPRMLPFLRNEDNLSAFAAMYARKMISAWTSGLPIIRYEDFVQDPETWLKKLCGHMGVDYDPMTVRSHEAFSEGELGHGDIPLWKPIHAGSLNKYQKMPKQAFNRIYALTASACELYGYKVQKQEVEVVDIDHRF